MEQGQLLLSADGGIAMSEKEEITFMQTSRMDRYFSLTAPCGRDPANEAISS